MKDLSDRLAALSPEQRALLEARLQEKGLRAPRATTIRPIPQRETLPHFPTSLDQERLWFIDQMEPGNPAYNIHTTTRMTGPMEIDWMRRAVNIVIARHEVLRTTFHVVDGSPVQVVAPTLEIEIPVIDLTHVPESERETAAQKVATESASVRFDLERGPLIQVVVARLAPEDHLLMICMQHAITDRWSFDVFEREVGDLYQALRTGREVSFQAPPIQFADFAVWQREELSGERGERHLEYWRTRLAGAPLVLEIPTDHPRPPVQTFLGARTYLVYPEPLMRRLKELTQRAGATMFMTMLAALDVLCWKYSGQRDLVIGSAIADRNRPETENVLGYFLNMLLLRATIDPARSFAELLAQVRETSLGAYAHQDVPFASLVDALKPRQDPSRNPLIQISYIYLDFPIMTTPEEAGFTADSLDVDNGASRFDMTLACTELPGVGIHSYIEYNTDLYDKPKVDRMLAHLGTILEFAAWHPDRPLTQLEICTAEERTRQLVHYNATSRPYDEACLHQFVERSAAATPEAPALVCGSDAMTFGELEEAGEALARELRGLGAASGRHVPVCLERSVAQVAALLGIMKTGAAYVPMDPSLPPERLRHMAETVRPVAVLVDAATRPLVPDAGLPIVELDARGHATQVPDAPGGPAPRADGFDLRDAPAYVMFTSGSTGLPKGVTVTHRAIGNRLLWSQDRYPLDAGDRVLHNASFAFDIAAWEVFGPLRQGACVVMAREGEHKDPAALVRKIHDERITVAHFVPSVLRAILEEPGLAACTSLRLVLCGGESMDRELHDRFFERLPGRALAHFYGPTEAAISCLYWDCRADLAPGRVPLGHPIGNMQAYLLDGTLHPVPAGVPGEIYLGGRGLALGYHERTDLTAERFVPDPFGGTPGTRLYRTGDLAQFREDGALEFLGRVDHQIKMRGYRIEPGEIESILESFPGIGRAVAVARGEGAGQHLVAYVETLADANDATPPSGASGTPGGPDEAAMRTELRRRLPDYMVPSHIVSLASLPLNRNGKIDRAALPDPGAPAAAAYVAPRTPVEGGIAQIWQTVLKQDRIGATDDFFDRGGNSLLATQVVSRLRTHFQVEFPLRRFFEGSTVESLAATVEEILLQKLESMTDEDAAQLLAMLRESSTAG